MQGIAGFGHCVHEQQINWIKESATAIFLSHRMHTVVDIVDIYEPKQPINQHDQISYVRN